MKERGKWEILYVENKQSDEAWKVHYPGVETVFFPEGNFDHSPMIVQFFKQILRTAHFKFCNFWATKNTFLNVVKGVWATDLTGYRSYQVNVCLYLLRKALKENFHKFPIQVRLEEAEGNLQWLRISYKRTQETLLLQMKCRVLSLSKQQRRIMLRMFSRSLESNGSSLEMRTPKSQTHNALEIQQAFTSFYSDLLCHLKSDRKKINMNIIHAGLILSNATRSQLDLSFSKQDIKRAMWSIPDDKAPGMDGYNSRFYKAA
ncbi:uncharacterized protein LOC130807342 [Amaranthus tricolor]|uniref:uncharacterized protein LOC130807342 n=1 Tax=Amaranthus tricolor TaxID=29722 RepID=UPI00259004F5|nr:uncharacterized protein LOC130807342 [Amaranthus tricolor]